MQQTSFNTDIWIVEKANLRNKNISYISFISKLSTTINQQKSLKDCKAFSCCFF